MSPTRKTSPRRKPLSLASFNLADQLRGVADSVEQGSWPHTGRHFSFPILSGHLGGFHDSLYVLAGASRMGKTTFALQMAFGLLRENPDTHVLFVSLDQPARDLNLRLVAMAGEAMVDYVAHPDPLMEEKYERKREIGMRLTLDLASRLTVVDESLGALSMDEIRAFVDEKRRDFDGPLVLFLDPLYKVRVGGITEFAERGDVLAQELKTLCMSQKVGVMGTTRLAHGAGRRRPSLEDLEEQPGLLYEAQAIMLFYCDYFNNGDTPFLEWEWGTDDLMVPVCELNLAKNKMGGFAGRLYYRFYNSFSKFKECPQLEIDNYERMLRNLQQHDPTDPTPDDSKFQRVEVIDET